MARMLAAMPGIASRTSDVLDVVGEAVRRQQCILFLGAGVHAPPPGGSRFSYPFGERLPTGAQLSRQLADQCDFAARFPREDATNLQRVALAYEIKYSRHRLVDAIVAAVDAGKAPSPMLAALARLDFPLVITTNYDRLFERALSDAGKQPRTSIYKPTDDPTTDYENESGQSPVIYKLHGDIDQRQLVITDEDYIQFVLRMNDKDPYDPIPLSLKHFLKRWTTLFIGYSLLDYNLRLLFKTLRWRIDPARVPETYSVDLRPDELIVDVWQSQRRYVTFIAEDVWSFVPALYGVVRGEELSP